MSCPRQHQQRSWWLLVLVLLSWGAAIVSDAGARLYYTPPQRAHTLRFLLSFTETIPLLRSRWRGSDFCRWNGVSCRPEGVSVEAAYFQWWFSHRGRGSLPELPPDVDGTQVVVRRILFGSDTDVVLFGTLPASWGRLTRLSELDLRSNSLDGTLPASWGGLTALTSLNLYANALRGTLPATWSRMQSVTDINLDFNGLGGRLPASWSALPALETLSVRYNQLSGPLPASWGRMRSLTALYVSRNAITGPVPASWGTMPRLRRISLVHNNLCGCLPAEWLKRLVFCTADVGMLYPFCMRWDPWCLGDGDTDAPVSSSTPPYPSHPTSSPSPPSPSTSPPTTSTPSATPAPPGNDSGSTSSSSSSSHNVSHSSLPHSSANKEVSRSASASSSSSLLVRSEHSSSSMPQPSTSHDSGSVVSSTDSNGGSASASSVRSHSDIRSSSSSTSHVSSSADSGAGEVLSSSSSASSSTTAVTSVSVESSSEAAECDRPVPFFTPAQEAATRMLLLALRDAFALLATWWTSTNFCTWTGVTCSGDGVASLHVNLANRGLVGVMPSVPEVGDDEDIMVASMVLRDNRGITGRIDRSWLFVPHLKVLDVNNCSLSDSLPIPIVHG